jgi:hypothetical protein
MTLWWIPHFHQWGEWQVWKSNAFGGVAFELRKCLKCGREQTRELA